jgi:20S proteasome alpha/beta subunit
MNPFIPRLKRPPYPSLKPKRKAMTIAVGLIRKTGKKVICIAADSQTTYGEHSKRLDAVKITNIKFEGPHQNVIIAQAGDADNAARTLEILAELAKETEIKDRRTVAELVQQAMVEKKREMRKQQCNCSMEKLRDYILKHELDFQFLIGHFFKGEPIFYVADFWVGAANAEYSHFATIGTGSLIGNYILQEFYSPEMPFQSIYAAAIYAVEEVKKVDNYCSGDTKAFLLLPDGEGSFHLEIRGNLMNKYVQMMKKINPHIREKHTEILETFLNEVASEVEKNPKF